MITGLVRSANGCRPLEDVRVQVWLATETAESRTTARASGPGRTAATGSRPPRRSTSSASPTSTSATTTASTGTSSSAGSSTSTTAAPSSISRSRVAEPAAAPRRRAPVLAAVALAAGAVPLVLALTDRHLDGASTALVLSTAAAAIAIPVIAFQPLRAGRGRIDGHRLIGSVALVLVLVHIGALFVESADDTLFAMSPDGPTRARMALMATIALVIVAGLGAGAAGCRSRERPGGSCTPTSRCS